MQNKKQNIDQCYCYKIMAHVQVLLKMIMFTNIQKAATNGFRELARTNKQMDVRKVNHYMPTLSKEEGALKWSCLIKILLQVTILVKLNIVCVHTGEICKKDIEYNVPLNMEL